MRGRWGDVFRVGATFVGTVVGAGFASGQEALRFFVAFGGAGLLGVGLAALLFAVLGAALMEAGAAVGARSHRELLVAGCGPRLGAALDLLVTAFLFAALAVMVAGGGAVAAEQFGLPAWAGALGTAGMTLLTVLAGLQGLVSANGVVVPMLVTCVLALAAHASGHPPAGGQAPGTAHGIAPAAPHWVLAALLYAGYNLVLSLPVLGPLGAAVGDGRVLRWGGALGGLTLGVLGVALHRALALHIAEAGTLEVPLLHLARQHGPAMQGLFAAVLWAEIYTTAIAGAFGITRRIAPEGDGPRYRAAALAAVAAAVAASRLGFGALVATVYPAFGYVSLPVLALLARGRRAG